jgi:nucleotide-binding universal stress UspA family protein
VITIVIGFDGRPGGHDALTLGRRLGRMLDSELVVVCAYPFEDGGGRTGEAFTVASRAEARRTLEQARRIVGRAEQPTFVAIPGPSPAQVLHETAEGAEGSVIVTGVSGRLADHAPGTGTTWRVLHHAPCAVAVAPTGWALRDRPLRRVGIAYDGHREAREGLETALALLDQSRGPLDRVEVVQVEGRAGRRGSDDAPGRLAVLGPVREVRLEGEAADALVAHGDSLDLLVLGSHDRGALGRLLLGSVSREVVTRARIPVLVRPWSGPRHTVDLTRAAVFL